jgi:N-glycosylase/DNA lyase
MTAAAGSRLAPLAVQDFDLHLTLGCGQVFHWTPEGAGYLGVIEEQPLYVEQRDGEFLVTAAAEETARRYFALDHPLTEIYASFPGDPAMSAALEFCRGMRIVRQPLWECVATFITSSMKQVAHIAQISHTLRRRFGKRLEYPRRWRLSKRPICERARWAIGPRICSAPRGRSRAAR